MKWYCWPVSSRADDVAAIESSVLQPDGRTPRDLRLAAFRGDELPNAWSSYVYKIRDESYRISDEDIQQLGHAGCAEDAIFEVTIAAAVGAARLGLEAGLRALSQAN